MQVDVDDDDFDFEVEDLFPPAFGLFLPIFFLVDEGDESACFVGMVVGETLDDSGTGRREDDSNHDATRFMFVVLKMVVYDSEIALVNKE